MKLLHKITLYNNEFFSIVQVLTSTSWTTIFVKDQLFHGQRLGWRRVWNLKLKFDVNANKKVNDENLPIKLIYIYDKTATRIAWVSAH